MVPPVRWYHLLSTWIFILSAAYPIHKISTYPLNILALIGCLEPILNPFRSSVGKNLYIMGLHLLPLLWIPYDVSMKAIQFAFVVGITYLIFVKGIGENPFHIYSVLLNEDQPTFQSFTCARFSYC
jgi:hypothetical protein